MATHDDDRARARGPDTRELIQKDEPRRLAGAARLRGEEKADERIVADSAMTDEQRATFEVGALGLALCQAGWNLVDAGGGRFRASRSFRCWIQLEDIDAVRRFVAQVSSAQ